MITNGPHRHPALAFVALALALSAGSVTAPLQSAAGTVGPPAPAPADPPGPALDLSRVLPRVDDRPGDGSREPATRRPGAEPARTEDRRRPVAETLPLGLADLTEKRTVRKLADGVTLTVIRRGDAPAPRKKAKSATHGPWVVRALTIDPDQAEGRLGTTYGPNLAAAAKTSSLTRRADALAGVNASFFALGSRIPGDPVGLTVAAGKVLSEPTGMDAEVTLLVDSARNTLRMGSFRWSGSLRNSAGEYRLRLDKVNSTPHVPKGCATRKKQARCTEPGQVVAFSSEFAKRTPRGVGAELVLDRDGCPLRVHQSRGVRLGGGKSSVQATGAAARQVRALAKGGCLETRHSVRDEAGEEVSLRKSTAAVTGRHQLLERGRVVVPDRSGGFFGRHPRTFAGTTWDGKIVLVTIDGRQRHSVGATLREAARVARALGLREAVNLDGGGSTSMSVRGKLVNDVPGRERAVSDALVWRRER